MTIQYLSDSRGVKQMVQVQIPIKEWEKAGHRMLIEDNEATTKPNFMGFLQLPRLLLEAAQSSDK